MAEKRDKQAIGTARSLTPVRVEMSYGGGGANWFGPLAPMTASAPPEVKGRILDYPAGFNLSQKPRQYEALGYDQLRGFADSYDLLRLIIETRKDQLGRMRWNIVPRDHIKKQRRQQQQEENAKQLQEAQSQSPGPTGEKKTPPTFGKADKPSDDLNGNDVADPLDAKIMEIERFFIRPDKVHFWDEWLRMLLEDLFVIDAPTIFRRRTYGKELYALEPIDGATIKRVIDPWGRTPQSGPAYQQCLKGLPAVDYTVKDLIYRPRNIRTNKVYGFSPVEQIVMTVNIALRRQMWQLQAFTEGNIPEALIGTPMTWTPDQIAQFQSHFDSMMTGNTGERRRARFVPGELAKGYVPTKPVEIFQKEAEEWLARVVCYCFSVSPQPFIQMMNRATAETAQETAVEEGLAPIQKYIKNVMDTVLLDDFGVEDLEFMWADEDELDPNIKSQILDRDSASGRLTINEARIDSGKDPYPEPEFDRPMLKTASGWVPVVLTQEEKDEKAAQAALIAGGPPGAPKPPGAPGDAPPGQDDHDPHETADDEAERSTTADQEVAEKSARPFVQRPEGHAHCASASPRLELGKSDTAEAHGKTFVNPDRKKATKATKAVKRRIAAAFTKTGKDVAKQIAMKLKGLGKADDDIDIDEILRGLHIQFDSDLADDLAEEIGEIYSSSGAAGLAQLGVKMRSELVDQVNDRAADWAEENAADLVTGIEDATRDMLRSTIASGLADGMTAEEIASSIEDGYAFGEERSQLIAETEIASANSEGALAGYEEAANEGISVKKSWLILDDACDDCQENADAGAIDLDEMFPTGDDAPPAHPNCRCVLVPEVEEGGDLGEEDAAEAENDVESEG